MTRPVALDDVLAALDEQEDAVRRLEERVERLEKAAGVPAGDIDVATARESAAGRGLDYGQDQDLAREQLDEQERGL